MEPEYIELVLNDRLIRIDKNNSMNVWCWRDCKTKPSYWLKLKPNFVTNKNGYKYYKINIIKSYALSRVVYKAYNNDWDITDISDTNHIDHKNINSLDNRIENLRIVTHQQNRWNSKAKGYNWDKKYNKWRARIGIDKKRLNLGYFDNEEDARQAYLNAKELYHKLPVI